MTFTKRVIGSDEVITDYSTDLENRLVASFGEINVDTGSFSVKRVKLSPQITIEFGKVGMEYRSPDSLKAVLPSHDGFRVVSAVGNLEDWGNIADRANSVATTRYGVGQFEIFIDLSATPFVSGSIATFMFTRYLLAI